MKKIYLQKTFALLLLQGLYFTGSAQLAGLYTINNSSATAGTNFNNFVDLSAALTASGVAGPVTVNVASAAVYSGQVLFTQATGISAVNNIVINGNGATLTAQAPVGQPWTLGLNGADYMTFNDLVMIGNGSYALTCHLYSNANNNRFSKCRMECPLNGFAANQMPFSISGSPNNGVQLGISGNNNVVISCTLSGGSFGVGIGGNTGPPYTTGNQIISCSISDFYGYGIYMNNSGSSIVKLNVIERPFKTAIAVYYGVFLSAGCQGTIIDGNRLRHPARAVPGSNIGSYGIYCAGSGIAGGEIQIRNNLVSDINTNGGFYGIYNNGNQYVNIYHNTISLDDFASTYNSASFGIYTGGLNTYVKNNLISMSRGGTGLQYGLYYASTMGTGTLTSNGNFVYFPPGVAATTGRYGYHWATGLFVTHSSWVTANNMDLGGGSLQPYYINPFLNNYMPSSSALNDLGIPVGVMKDILDAPRSATTPDPGAFESFLTSNCATCTKFSGKFYNDCNSNCAYDLTDMGLNWKVFGRIYNNSGVDITFVPGVNGEFMFSLPGTGTYSLTQFATTPAHTACSTGTLSIPPGTVTNTFLFGYKTKSFVDPQVTVRRASGFNNVGGVRFTVNAMAPGSFNGCNPQVPIPGKMKVVLNQLMSFKSVIAGSAPDAIISASTGDTLVWNIPNFHLVIAKTISLAVAPNSTGKPYLITAKITPGQDDELNNNTCVHSETVGAPSDPNIKLVYAEIMNNKGELPPNLAQEMFYTIYFQNVGTAPAINVKTTDTIDAGLELSTLQILQSSFPANAVIDQNSREVNFLFNHIYLPDSASDPEGSWGFVRYSVKMKSGLPVGTVIKNRAHNYFDTQPPVATNQTINKIVLDVSIPETSSLPGKITVVPNPFESNFTIRSEGPLHTVSVFDLSGRKLKYVEQAGTREMNMEMGEFSGGVYILQVNSSNGTTTNFKVVKQ